LLDSTAKEKSNGQVFKVCWLHFTGKVDESKITSVNFFSEFCIPKIIQIGLLLTELFQKK